MATCPSCRRPVATARPTCLYCGAPLPSDSVAGAAAPPTAGAKQGPSPAPDTPPGAPRSLIVIDLAHARPESLVRGLGLPPYQAGLLARRGGLHLHRALEAPQAEQEAARLAAEDVPVVLVPEEEARLRPVRVIGGERSRDALTLRTEEGALVVRQGDLMLVVRGPIAREYQPSFERRRVRTAGLAEGYFVHLHRRSEPRPLEIDAANFEPGPGFSGSVRLEIDACVEAVGHGAPRDDEFRRLPPALGPAEPEPKGALAAVGSLHARDAREAVRAGASGAAASRADTTPVLDNVAQFRFYSGWRAAVERRRGDASP